MQNVQCTYPPLQSELVDAINAIEQRHDGFTDAERSETIDQPVYAATHPAATDSLDRTPSTGASSVERVRAGLRAVRQRRVGTRLRRSPRATTSVDVQRVRSAYAPLEQWRLMR